MVVKPVTESPQQSAARQGFATAGSASNTECELRHTFQDSSQHQNDENRHDREHKSERSFGMGADEIGCEFYGTIVVGNRKTIEFSLAVD